MSARPQHLPASQIIDEMAAFGEERIRTLTAVSTLILGFMGGGFITVGALFSILLARGIESEGLKVLLEGFGFSAGFFFVVLSEAALFTEANVVMPSVLLEGAAARTRVLRFWAIALVGNFLGALVVGALISFTQTYGAEFTEVLEEILGSKLAFSAEGSAGAWGRALLSGILANWLVGMAAFFAMMGRTIIGKYIPVFLAVTLFVAANFQHSPANMGFFSIAIAEGADLTWLTALGWSIIPVGIGNIIGGTLGVALPFWYVFSRD